MAICSALVFERDASIPGDNPARQSKLLKYLDSDAVHRDIGMTRDDILRLAAWMDTYRADARGIQPRTREATRSVSRRDAAAI